MITCDTMGSSASGRRAFCGETSRGWGTSVPVVGRELIEADAWKTEKRLLVGKRVMPR